MTAEELRDKAIVAYYDFRCALYVGHGLYGEDVIQCAKADTAHTWSISEEQVEAILRAAPVVQS